MRIRQNEICFFLMTGIPEKRVLVYDNDKEMLGNQLGLRAELPVKGDIVAYFLKGDDVKRYGIVKDRLFDYPMDQYMQRQCLVDIFLEPMETPSAYLPA